MSDFDIKIEVVESSEETPTTGETLKNSALRGDLGIEMQTEVLRKEISRLSRVQDAQIAQDIKSQAFADRQASIRETLELKIAARREQSEIKLSELSEGLALRTADKVARAQEMAALKNIQREERASDEMAKKIGRSVVALNPGGLFKTIFTGFSESIGRAAFQQFKQVTKETAVDPGKYIGNVAGGLYNRASIPVARGLGYNSPQEMRADVNKTDPLAMVDRMSVAFSRGNREAVKVAAESNKKGLDFLKFYFENLQQTVGQELEVAKSEIVKANQKRVVSASLYLSQPYLEYRRALGLAEAVKKSKEIQYPEFSKRDVEAIQRVPTGGTLVVGNPGYTPHGQTAGENFGLNVRQSLGLEYVPLDRRKQTDFLKTSTLPENFKEGLKDKDVFSITKQGLSLIANSDKQFKDALPKDFLKNLSGAKDSIDLIPLIESALKTRNEKFRAALFPFLERIVTGSNVDLAEQIAQINHIKEMRPDINVKYIGYSGGSAHVRDIEQTTGIKGIAMGSIINEDRDHPSIVGSEDAIARQLADIDGFLKNTKRFENAGQRHKAGFYFDKPEVSKYLAETLGAGTPTGVAPEVEDANFKATLLNAALEMTKEALNSPKLGKATVDKTIKTAQRVYDSSDALEGKFAALPAGLRSVIETAPKVNNEAYQHLGQQLDKYVREVADIPLDLNLEEKTTKLREGFIKISTAVEDYIYDSHKFVKQELVPEPLSEKTSGLTQFKGDAKDTISPLESLSITFNNVKEGAESIVLAERKLAKKVLEIESILTFGLAERYRKFLGQQTKEAASGLGQLGGAYFQQKMLPGMAGLARSTYGSMKSVEDLALSLMPFGVGHGAKKVFQAGAGFAALNAVPGVGGLITGAGADAAGALAIQFGHALTTAATGAAPHIVQPIITSIGSGITALLGSGASTVGAGIAALGAGATATNMAGRLLPAVTPDSIKQALAISAAKQQQPFQLSGQKERMALPFSVPLPVTLSPLPLPPAPDKKFLSGTSPEADKVISLLNNLVNQSDDIYEYIDTLNKKQLEKIASRLNIKYSNTISKEVLKSQLKEVDFRNLSLSVEAQKHGNVLPKDKLDDFKQYTKQIQSGLGVGTTDPQSVIEGLKGLKIRYELNKSQSASINKLIQNLEEYIKNQSNSQGLAGYEIEDSEQFKIVLARAKRIVQAKSDTNLQSVPIEVDPQLGSAGLMTTASGSPVVKIKSDSTSGEVILHELRHAAQVLNPALKLMTPKDVSPDEFDRVKSAIAHSTKSYMDRNPNASYEDLDRVHAMETDAYLFAQKFRKEMEAPIRKPLEIKPSNYRPSDFAAVAAFEIPDPWENVDTEALEDLIDTLNKTVRATPPKVQKLTEPSVNRFEAEVEAETNSPFNQKISELGTAYSKRKPKEVGERTVVGGGSPEGIEFQNLAHNLKTAIVGPFRLMFTDVEKELKKLKSLYNDPKNNNPELTDKAQKLVGSLKPESIKASDKAKIQDLNQEFEKYYKLRDVAERKLSGNLTPTEKMVDMLETKMGPLVAHFEDLTGIQFDGNIGKFLKDIVSVGIEKTSLFTLPLLLSKIAIDAKDAAFEFDKFRLQMTGLGEGQAEIEKLNESILRTGANINASREAYLGFKSGLIGTNNESQFGQIFENLQVTLKNRVPDADKQKLVVQGLVQMLSKGGAVQSEEFRGQVSESLRGSMQLAQAATGFDATTFTRKLKKQEIQAETFVPAFLAAGRGGLQAEGDTATEKMERFNSQTQMLNENIGKLPMELFATGADLVSKAIDLLNKNSWLLSFITGTVLVRSLIGVSSVFITLIEKIAGTTIAQVGYIGVTKALGSTLQSTAGFALNFAKSMLVPAAVTGTILGLIDLFLRLGATQGEIGTLVDRMKQLNEESIRKNKIAGEKPDKSTAPGSDLQGVEAEHWTNKADNQIARFDNVLNRFFGLKLEEENIGTRREVTEGAKKADEGIVATRANFQRTTQGLLATTPEDISKFAEYSRKEQVLKTRISIAANEGDTETVVKLNEELSKLQQNKDPVVAKIFGNQGDLTEQANVVRATIKDIESQIEKNPQKQHYYEKQLQGYKTLLAEMDNGIKTVGTKLQPEIIALAKFKSNVESLDAQFEQKTKAIAISKAESTQVADATKGTNEVSRVAIGNAKVEIGSIQKELANLQEYRKGVIKRVLDLDPNTKAVLETALGKSLTKASGADIDRVLADVEKYNISKPQEAVLQSLKKINENSVQVAQKQLDLDNAQQSYVKAQIDFTNQLADYYRNRERALMDEAIAVQRFNRGFSQQATDAVLQAQTLGIGNLAQQWKNQFSKAIIGSTDSLVTSLATTLSGVIDDTKAVMEGKVAGQKLYTDLNRTLQGANESVYDQNLQNRRSAEDRSIQDRDMFGQQRPSGAGMGVLYSPSLVTKGTSERDLANLALTVLQESSGRQNQLDVAVSMFNRLAKGGYGNSLTGVAFRPGQYEPNFGKSPVNTIDEAAARLGGGSAKSEIMRLISDLRDSNKVRSSQAFIQGATDFKGTSQLRYRQAGDPYRGSNGANFFHETNSPQLQNRAVDLISRSVSGITRAPANAQPIQDQVAKLLPKVKPQSEPLKIQTISAEQAKLDPKYQKALEAQTAAQYKQIQVQNETSNINKQANQISYIRSTREEILRRQQEIASRRRDIQDRVAQSKGFVDPDLKTFRDAKYGKDEQITRLKFDKENLDRLDIPAMQELLAKAQKLNELKPGTVDPEVIKSASASLAAMVDQSRALEESINDLNKIDGEVPLLMSLNNRLLSVNSELMSTKSAFMDLQSMTALTEGDRNFFGVAKSIADVRDKFNQNRISIPIEIKNKELERDAKAELLKTSTDLSPEVRAKYEEELRLVNEVIDAKKELLAYSNPERQAQSEYAITSKFTKDNRRTAESLTQGILSQRQDELAKQAYGFAGTDIRNVAAGNAIRNDTRDQLDNLNEMRVVLQAAGVDVAKLQEDIISLGELRLDNLTTSASEFGQTMSTEVAGAIVTAATDLADLLVDPTKSVLDVFKSLASSILSIFSKTFAEIAQQMLAMSLKKGFSSMFGGIFGALGNGLSAGAGGGGMGGLAGSIFGGLFGSGGGAATGFSFTPVAGFRDSGTIGSGGAIQFLADGGLVQGSLMNSIASAMAAEGEGARLAVLHSGELALSRKNGDAQRFQRMVADGVWDSYGGIQKFSSGGMVSSAPQMMGGSSKNYLQNTYVSNVIIKAQDPNTFRNSQSQIQAETDRQNRIASAKQRPY